MQDANYFTKKRAGGPGALCWERKSRVNNGGIHLETVFWVKPREV